MARIKNLPSQEVIKGYKGVLDYVSWRGISYTRTWPKTPRSHLTPATLSAASLFGEIVQAYRLTDPTLLAMLADETKDQPLSPRDFYVKAVLGHLHLPGGHPVTITLLDLQTTDIEVKNTTSEVTIYQFTLPGGTLATNHLLLLTLHCQLQHATSNAQYIRVILKYGATTLISTYFPLIKSDLKANPTLHFYLKADGASNKQRAALADGAMTITPGYPSLATPGAEGTAAEDSTLNKDIKVTVVLSTGSTVLWINRRAATLVLITPP